MPANFLQPLDPVRLHGIKIAMHFKHRDAILKLEVLQQQTYLDELADWGFLLFSDQMVQISLKANEYASGLLFSRISQEDGCPQTNMNSLNVSLLNSILTLSELIPFFFFSFPLRCFCFSFVKEIWPQTWWKWKDVASYCKEWALQYPRNGDLLLYFDIENSIKRTDVAILR